MRWIAEDVPWYSIGQGLERPWTDEDLGITATRRIGSFDSEEKARGVIAAELRKISGFNHVRLAGETGKYQAAAVALEAGVDLVRISGRAYRVRGTQ